MTPRRSLGSIDARVLAIALVAMGLVAFVATRRLHPIQGLGNPDIGGILYSADALNHGLLPYRDTVDLKPPGTFFLVAAVFRFLARDLGVLHLAYACWLLAGAPAMVVAARALFGDDERSVVSQGLATALYLVTIGTFDMNYSSWMTPAYAWSFALFARGLTTGARSSFVLAGAVASMAYVLKSHAVVLAPLFLVGLGIGRREKASGARLGALAPLALGAALGAAPLVVFYASKGALLELARGLFPIETALRYSARRNQSWREIFALWLVPRQQLVYFPLQWALAAASCVGALVARKEPRRPPSLALAAAFFVASLAGCALGGFRFYLHYLPQCLPSLALLAAHPAGLDLLRRATLPSPSRVRTAARTLALVVGGAALFVLGKIPLGRAAAYDNGGSPAVELTGRFVHDVTRRDDRVLVWGWQAWGVYYFADRRSPSSLFKMLGEVTELNDNSELGRASPIHFRDGPLAERLVRDFDATPPAVVVRTSPFFPGVKDDPLDEFVALKSRLDRDYQAVLAYGRITVYQRKAPAPAAAPK